MRVLLLIPAWFWLILSCLFFAAGEYLSKAWAYHPSFAGSLLVVGVYALGTFAWLPALFQKNQLAVMGTAWLLLATMATVLIGALVYHEAISIRQYTGICMALIAMGLLAL